MGGWQGPGMGEPREGEQRTRPLQWAVAQVSSTGSDKQGPSWQDDQGHFHPCLQLTGGP